MGHILKSGAQSFDWMPDNLLLVKAVRSIIVAGRNQHSSAYFICPCPSENKHMSWQLRTQVTVIKFQVKTRISASRGQWWNQKRMSLSDRYPYLEGSSKLSPHNRCPFLGSVTFLGVLSNSFDCIVCHLIKFRYGVSFSTDTVWFFNNI